jgi:putative membrane protein
MLRNLWLIIFFAVLIWSAIAPKDLFTWLLEVFPALIALVVLAKTERTFPLTPLLYSLILLHAIILMVGGHYTYAEVPLFDWIQEWTGSARNNYDKLGHLAQGFVPALVARELVIRKQIIRGRGWQNFFCVCTCLAISSVYELLEWSVALASGAESEAFLGTQGYVWDTQSDMFYALIGAVTALLTLSRYHDRQLAQFNKLK